MAMERRHGARRNCRGIGEVHVLRDGQHASGYLVNLSAGGCCIEFETMCFIPMHTTVEVHLRLLDYGIRIAGQVSNIRQRNRIGITFLDVNSRKAEQISYLIKELLIEGKEKLEMAQKERSSRLPVRSV